MLDHLMQGDQKSEIVMCSLGSSGSTCHTVTAKRFSKRDFLRLVLLMRIMKPSMQKA